MSTSGMATKLPAQGAAWSGDSRETGECVAQALIDQPCRRNPGWVPVQQEHLHGRSAALGATVRSSTTCTATPWPSPPQSTAITPVGSYVVRAT